MRKLLKSAFLIQRQELVASALPDLIGWALGSLLAFGNKNS